MVRRGCNNLECTTPGDPYEHTKGRLPLFAIASVSVNTFRLCALHHSPVSVKKPSAGALLLGLIPFAAMCFSVSFWDRIDPMLLGIPFNLFWLLSWIVLTTVCMWAAYRVETAQKKKARRTL